MILFAGFLAGSVLANDVWVLTQANGIGGTPSWVELNPSGDRPQERSVSNVGYRSETNRLVIFGGCRVGCEPPAFTDVWVLSGANGLAGSPAWIEVFPDGGPPPARVAYVTDAYDAVANRLIVFGGFTGPNPLGNLEFLNDVWVLELVPGLEVTPAIVDFGDVIAFTSLNMMVTISNNSGGEIVVTDIAVSGDPSFSVTAFDPGGPPITLQPGEDVFVTVTFSPISASEVTLEGTLTVTSDDPDEPVVSVQLIGNGLVDAVNEQTVLEAAVSAAIVDGTLVGSGSGKSAGGRLNAFANMIEASGDLIEAGFIGDACGQLRSALRRVDGDPRPPDFATGEGADLIAAQIEFLRTSLGCE